MRSRRWWRRRSWAPVLTMALLGMWGIAALVRFTRIPRPAPPVLGERVFLRERCYACHTINGQGVAAKGAWVELTQFRDRPIAELVAFLRDKTVRPTGDRSIMPSYAHLPDDELVALAHFIRRLSLQSKMPALWQGAPRRPNWHQRDDFILTHGKDMERNPDLCWRCHRSWDGKDLGLRFCHGCHQTRSPESHRRPDWLKVHGAIAKDEQGLPQKGEPHWWRTSRVCMACHSDAVSTPLSCNGCHQELWHRDEEGNLDRWIAVMHGVKWHRDRATCDRCHTEQPQECDRCHGTPMPHPKQWLLRAPHRAGRIDDLHERDGAANPHSCLKCHGLRRGDRSDGRAAQMACDECHWRRRPEWQRLFGQRPDDHTADWRRRHAVAARGQEGRCQLCHHGPQGLVGTDSCFHCHQTEMPHPPDWALQAHGPWTKQKGKRTCFAMCHQPDHCTQCHLPEELAQMR